MILPKYSIRIRISIFFGGLSKLVGTSVVQAAALPVATSLLSWQLRLHWLSLHWLLPVLHRLHLLLLHWLLVHHWLAWLSLHWRTVSWLLDGLAELVDHLGLLLLDDDNRR